VSPPHTIGCRLEAGRVLSCLRMLVRCEPMFKIVVRCASLAGILSRIDSSSDLLKSRSVSDSEGSCYILKLAFCAPCSALDSPLEIGHACIRSLAILMYKLDIKGLPT